MAWIKRNLYFLIGTLIALGLMGYGCYVLMTKIAEEKKVVEDITAQFAEKERLGGLNPSADDKNIKAAKDQQATLLAYLAKVHDRFQRIAPIPDSPKVGNEEFAQALRTTLDQLTNAAGQQSVFLPPDYSFTFAAEKNSLVFEAGAPTKLSVQLGEIKALCGILFDAKINALDRLRREGVTTNDLNGGNDYTSEKTTVTPLADLVPYEIVFRSFSGELAGVMARLAGSSAGIMIKTINIEPAPEDATNSITGMNGVINPAPVPQPFNYNQLNQQMQSRRGGRGPNGPMAPQPVAPTAPTPTRGPTTFLDEKPLKITMVINLVRLKAAK